MKRSWSERDIIKKIRDKTQKTYPGLVHGIGDDCAVIHPTAGKQAIVTTDMLVEDVHFSLAWHPPYELGRKTIAVNLSDIAGMGGQPHFIFLSLCLPSSVDTSWLERWINGICSMIEEFDCCLAGGDTVCGETLMVTITVIGSVDENRACLRNSAKADQSIYVTGELGSAAAGLLLFQNQRSDLLQLEQSKPFIKRHLDPSPDVELGIVLASSELVTSMQDISDGIATDLSHICTASGIGAVVEESMLPHHESLPWIANELHHTPTDLMVSGGEDYHLIFTVENNRDDEFQKLMLEKKIAVTRIGKTRVEKGVFIQSGGNLRNITYQGYEH